MTPLKIINACLLISFILQFLSSAALMFPVPSALAHWAYSIHAANGKIFLSLALCHIYLNRYWIINHLFKKGVSA